MGIVTSRLTDVRLNRSTTGGGSGGSGCLRQTVVRLNQSPTAEQYVAHVGSRTTMRALNPKWLAHYENAKLVKRHDLPLEKNVTLLAARSAVREERHPPSYAGSKSLWGVECILAVIGTGGPAKRWIASESQSERVAALADAMRSHRSAVSVVSLNPKWVSSAKSALTAYKKCLKKAGTAPFPGGDAPSAGIISTHRT
eukprot:1181400-Prorocentrum_minimum.AAC.1